MTKTTPRTQVIERLVRILSAECGNLQPCYLCRADAKRIARSRLLRITLAPTAKRLPSREQRLAAALCGPVPTAKKKAKRR